MKLVFMGPPGSGKGTQSEILSKFYNIVSLSTGDLLRSNIKSETEIGKIAKSFIEGGDLVPDEVIVKMVEKKLSEIGFDKGFILDGFPRTIGQAISLEKILENNNSSIVKVINFMVPDEIIIKRISGRFSCDNCGAIYNKFFKKTKNEGECDFCSSKLFSTRSDDNETSVINRLKNYHQTTSELIEYYSKKDLIVSINAEKNPQDIFEEIKIKLI